MKKLRGYSSFFFLGTEGKERKKEEEKESKKKKGKNHNNKIKERKNCL